MTPDTHETPGATNTEGFSSTESNQETEGSKNIMPDNAVNHETTLRNLSDFHIDQRQVITDMDNDWTRKGDEFHYKLFTITVDVACKIIIPRLFCDTPARRHQMLEKAHALRNGTFLDEESIDVFKVIEADNGESMYRVTYANVIRAVTCERDGCMEKGEVFPMGNHCCTLDLPENMTERGVTVFYDTEAKKWAVDVHVATSEYIDAETACLLAAALVGAAGACDHYNGAPIYRNSANAMAPETDGIGGGL